MRVNDITFKLYVETLHFQSQECPSILRVLSRGIPHLQSCPFLVVSVTAKYIASYA